MLGEIDLVFRDWTDDFETTFAIEFSESEIEAVKTVGDLCDLLLRKLPSNPESRKSATLLAFQMLRNALAEKLDGKRLTPSFDLSRLNRFFARELFKHLRESSGLDLWLVHESTRIGHVALGIGIGTAFIGIAGLLFVFVGGLGLSDRVFFALCSIAIIWIGIKCAVFVDGFDAGRVPDHYRTLREIAKLSAQENYGRLVRLGAKPAKDEIWIIVAENLAGWKEVPASDIARETRFAVEEPR